MSGSTRDQRPLGEPAPTAPALVADGLVVAYGARVVLRDLRLALAPGRVHGLVGRNGEGKTTLLETIAGYLAPRAGTVRWQGRPLVRGDVASLPAQPVFYPRITGREYLGVFRVRNPAFDADGWAHVFELPLDELVEHYSTGMQRKLALLGALCLDRRLLLLDEPFNGLDVEANRVLGRVLHALAAEGRTVLLTSHVLETLTGSCDVVHLLADGRIAGSYRAAEFARLEGELLGGGTAGRVALAAELLGARGLRAADGRC